MDVAGSLAIGVQASYLFSEDLEVGAVVAKATWNPAMGFGSAGSTVVPSHEPYPILWIGRVRYRSFLGELHRSSTGTYDIDSVAHDHRFRNTYTSIRLRYYLLGGFTAGADLVQYGHRVTRDQPPSMSGYGANVSVTSLRVGVGLHF
jgi:hypothetical protein